MNPEKRLPRIKPPALKKGGVIGIVAPASSVQREDVEAGCQALQRAGYRPFYLDSIFDRELYFAGSVERRVEELQEMFGRDEVDAIVCARGGYGSNYLLERLDWKKIKAQPKIFVGYSDQTALLTRLCDEGMVVFHGPMVAKDWASEDGVHWASWNAAVSGVSPWEVDSHAASGVVGLVDGSAAGTLYGGCLSILAASLGTAYEIHTGGAILFIEDVAEKPFRIDRMLMQLKLAGKLKDVRGIVFGEMKACAADEKQASILREAILRIVGHLGVPVAFGLRSGHVTAGNVTLPFGVEARLEVKGEGARLAILESAVST